MIKFRLFVLMGLLSISLHACGSAQDTSNAITNNNTNEAPNITIVNDVSKLVESSKASEASAEPSSEPVAEASAEPSAQPSEEPASEPVGTTKTNPDDCVYRPDDNGFLNVPLPDGSSRVLKPGEYVLLDNGKAVRVTKPGQADTGKVLEKNCTQSSGILDFCDKFPAKDGTIMVPYNGKERYLKSGEYELMGDKRSIRVTKPGAPDVGKVITPPDC